MSAFGGPTPRCDSTVLLGLQGLVLVMPIALGGRETWAQAGAVSVAILLLSLWQYKTLLLRGPSADRESRAPVWALIALSALVIFQTIPLPPWLLATVSPGAHALFVEFLPDWPGGGGWSAWRPLALEPLAAQVGLLRYGAPLAAFSILACYPWGSGAADREARRFVFGRLVATLLVSAVIIAAAALLERSLGNGSLLWIFRHPFGRDPYPGRAHGPFVNPNHLAGYLEMLIPLCLLHLVSVGRRVGRQLEHSTEGARRAAIPLRRSLVAAIVSSQRRFVAPLVALVALGLMLVAHQATDSRGGRLALGVAALTCILRYPRRTPTNPPPRRWWRAATAVIAVLVLGAVLVAQPGLETAEEATAAGVVDPSLGTRLIVVSQANPLLRQFFLIGVGLGSWVHAFRLRQAPPIDIGLWKQAHNDYLQFGVETGLIGGLILCCFAWAIARATRYPGVKRISESERDANLVPATYLHHRSSGGDGPERSDGWLGACGDWRLLRVGLTAGVSALLVHSLYDFNLQVAANALVFMTLLGLLVMSAATRSARASRGFAWIPALLIAIAGFGFAGPVLGVAPFSVAGRVSAAEQMDDAYVSFSVNGESVRTEAVELARAAVELAPLDPDAHEMLAHVQADQDAGDADYRRAIRLSPDGSRLRDALALRLWQRGERSRALTEFEESMLHRPQLVAHDYLTRDGNLEPMSSRARLDAIAAGGSVSARLRLLDPAIRGAIERGLRRALEEEEFIAYDAVAGDIATLLEADDRHAVAGAFLEEWTESTMGDGRYAKRAASDYLIAGDLSAAERFLTKQLTRAPDDGELYRLLAVDVYAAQGDLDTADLVLSAGRRNSADVLPVYQGMREVLTRRDYRGRRPPSDDSSKVETSRPRPPREALAARGHGS